MVDLLSLRDHVATCDSRLPPSQQRVDRRDRTGLRQAAEHRRLDKRVFTPIVALEAEAESNADDAAETEVDADVDVDSDLDLDSDSDSNTDSDINGELKIDDSAEENAEPSEFDAGGVVPIALPINKDRSFAEVDTEADNYAQTYSDSSSEFEAESEAPVDSYDETAAMHAFIEEEVEIDSVHVDTMMAAEEVAATGRLLAKLRQQIERMY